MSRRQTCSMLLAGFLVASPAWSQTVQVVELFQANAAFHHGFTRVKGCRELTDGRVIVLDEYDRTIHVIDANWTIMRQIGRRGAGPREYIEPRDIFALPGDSSVVFDSQNMRMLVITPDAEPGGFLNPLGGGGEAHAVYTLLRFSSAGIMLSTPTATDGFGRYYSRGQPITVTANGELELADSIAVERWNMTAPKRDTVAFVPYSVTDRTHIIPGTGSVGSTPNDPNDPVKAFRTHTQWAVGPDGRVAIVTHDPYRVKFVDAMGETVLGVPIEYESVRVTEGHKQQLRDKHAVWTQALVATSDGQSGTVNMPRRTFEYDWPKFLPPFLPRAVLFAMNGMLWVQRTAAADAQPTFDVIDGAGRVVQQVNIPHNRRLVGFGNKSVYLVRIDDVDLEYLERYRLPIMAGT